MVYSGRERQIWILALRTRRRGSAWRRRPALFHDDPDRFARLAHPLVTELDAVPALVALGMKGISRMENETDPLAQFGLDAIDLRWTLKDIATKRSWMINKQHLA